MKKLIVFILVGILVGCSTSPVSREEAENISDDRIYASFYKYSSPGTNKAKVIIVRDSGLLGGGLSVGFYVNGELISHIERGEFLELYLDEGENILGVLPEVIISSNPDSSDLVEQVLKVKSGNNYPFRISINSGNGLILQRTSQLWTSIFVLV